VHEHGVIEGMRVPLVASMVDQQAALFGHGCPRTGQVKITFAPAPSRWPLQGDRWPPRPTRHTAPPLPGASAIAPPTRIDGGVYNAASALDWAKRLGLFSNFATLSQISGPSALRKPTLVFVPALSGLAYPYWTAAPPACGSQGLDTTRLDLVQALLEGVALRSAQA